jgi:hypothetical protein
MLEILEFAFQSFWHFVGFLIILAVCVNSLAVFAALVYGIPDKKKKKKGGDNPTA